MANTNYNIGLGPRDKLVGVGSHFPLPRQGLGRLAVWLTGVWCWLGLGGISVIYRLLYVHYAPPPTSPDHCMMREGELVRRVKRRRLIAILLEFADRSLSVRVKRSG